MLQMFIAVEISDKCQWLPLMLSSQALLHASVACSLKPSVEWIAASDLEDESAKAVGFVNYLYWGYQLHPSEFICLKLSPCMQTPEAHAKAWETLKVRFLCTL